MHRSRFTAASALLLLGGCYAYRPVTSAQPATGIEVVADLTDRGTADLGTQLGPGITRIDGEVVEADSIALTLSVRQVVGRQGAVSKWSGDTLSIPRQYVASMRERTFSRTRSVLVGAAVAAGVAAFVAGIDLIVGEQVDTKGRTPPVGGT